MRKAFLAVTTSVVLTLVLAAPAFASHSAASVTTPLNSSYLTQGCHDQLFYFKGWYAPCKGIDIANGTYGDANVYLRGYYWSTARVVGANRWATYYNSNCTGFAGYEYSNAFEIDLPTGTAGVAFWHLDNYHYNPGSYVSNGTLVGTRAVTTRYKYYCSGRLASTGSHIHIEFASDGDLYNQYGSYSGYDPYITYWHP
jgi:hypothetical protein